MSVFNVFFDSPAKRPHQSYRSRLAIEQGAGHEPGPPRRDPPGTADDRTVPGRVAGQRLPGEPARPRRGGRLTTRKTGALSFTTRGSSPSRRGGSGWPGSIPRDELQREAVDFPRATSRCAVRHRTIVAESKAGAVACFPPPHQYFFPRDLTDNLKYVWFGSGHRKLDDHYRVRHPPGGDGGRPFVPWFNAPPGTEQRLGVFYLLSRGDAGDALRETLRYTHGDRFADLPGHVTFSSHWHMAIAVAAMAELAKGQPPDDA